MYRSGLFMHDEARPVWGFNSCIQSLLEGVGLQSKEAQHTPVLRKMIHFIIMNTADI